jgi:vitamin B12 transporter
MKTGWFVAMAALALAACPLGSGPVQAAEEGVYHLGEVVVSGEETGVEAVGVTHKVTAKEIEKRGARTLDQALNLLPGVNVRTGGDGKPRIDIRGFRTRHVKLLLNGTPFNGTYDGQFDPNIISVENISEIVVTTGGSSVLYGSGGNAGVINIITKKGAKGVHGSANVELVEGDSQLLRATGSYGADKYDVFVSGSLYERDHFELSDHFSPIYDGGRTLEDGDERENSDVRRDNFFANVGVSPTDATLIGLTFSYLNGEHGKPPVIVNDEFAPGRKFEREDDAEEFNVQLALDQDFAGPLSLKGWAYLNKLDVLENRYNGFNGNTTSDYDTQTANNTYRTDSTTEISGANLQLRYDLDRFGALTLSGMFENDDWESETITRPDNPSATDKSDEDFQLYSTALEYEVSPLPNLGVILGAGYHWQDRDEKDEEEYTYLIGLHYDLFEGTRLKASHARKVRFPTLRDLYDASGSNPRANPDLGAEITWHTEAGVEQVLPAATTASLTGFYIEIEDFIERPNDTSPVQNFEEYEFYGVEVAAENRYFERLFVRASYSYLHTEDKSSDSERDQIQNNPEHKVVLEATYQLPWNMSVYGSARWVANAYTYDDDKIEKKRLPEYLVFDFRLNKRVADVLDLYFGIDNAFDEDYETSYAFPQPGRTMYGGVTWKF